jgi:hypothetical protein
MGKDKNYANNNIVPSTTRRGTNLPSRPHFSPTSVASVTKKKTSILGNSPLSRISTSAEKYLLDDGKDKEGTPNLSKHLSSDEIESEN